jgi:hypothetical protein
MSIQYAYSPQYPYPANTAFAIYVGTNCTEVDLPLVNTVNAPIYVKNNNNNSVVVKYQSNTITTIPAMSTCFLYIDNTTQNWVVLFTSNITLPIPRGSALIPTLLGNVSKDDWMISASSNSTSSAPFNPFGGNDGTFWGPATGGPEYLRIGTPFSNSVSPNPLYVQAILWENRGGSSTNYFSNITFQGTNDLTNFTTLYTFTAADMQNANTINYIALPATVNFAAYQITITTTVGTATTLGFFNFNLIGYWGTN